MTTFWSNLHIVHPALSLGIVSPGQQLTLQDSITKTTNPSFNVRHILDENVASDARELLTTTTMNNDVKTPVLVVIMVTKANWIPDLIKFVMQNSQASPQGNVSIHIITEQKNTIPINIQQLADIVFQYNRYDQSTLACARAYHPQTLTIESGFSLAISTLFAHHPSNTWLIVPEHDLAQLETHQTTQCGFFNFPPQAIIDTINDLNTAFVARKILIDRRATTCTTPLFIFVIVTKWPSALLELIQVATTFNISIIVTTDSIQYVPQSARDSVTHIYIDASLQYKK